MINITVNIDETVKRDAEMLFDRLGFTLSDAINLFFHQAIQKQDMPFESITIPTPMFDERLSEAIKKSNPKRIRLEVDENGHVVVDPDLHPEIYDWAVNG